MKSLFENFLSLFFPSLCLWCENALLVTEKYICIGCELQLPKTNFHLTPGNAAEKTFYGRVAIENTSSFLFFQKGNITQQVVHTLKYKQQPQLGIFLGENYAYALKQCDWIKTIDIIIPVPLHKKRLAERAYNQSQMFARGLSQVLNIPYFTHCIEKGASTSSQTKRSRFSRWKNMEDSFLITDTTLLIGKNILLVDDVITTGATLEACAIEILKIPNTKVSIATIAYTQNN